MSAKITHRLLVFALFFLAHWFFGNLYEEIVLAPNQLSNSYQALQNWQEYFTITNQIYYYVPFTQFAVIALIVLFLKSTHQPEKDLLKKASIHGILAIVLTVLIVTQLNVKLFFGDLDKYRQQIHTLSVIWLIGNAIRLYLVGSSLYYTLKVWTIRQPQPASHEHA
ncbi:hypothetical protein ACO2Q8_28675 [Larkinella sp. VNQ87]|uniref:hypothetical protein n=1 Tax=Larkinella sp. VNQ87 TaxID=3400921 RepID=UPI003C0E4FFC